MFIFSLDVRGAHWRALSSVLAGAPDLTEGLFGWVSRERRMLSRFLGHGACTDGHCGAARARAPLR